MLPSFDPLITAAVKPLSKNAEQKLAVSEMLREKTDPADPDAAAAIARWEEMDAKKRPDAWKAVLYAITAVSIVAFIIIGFTMNRSIRMIRAISSFGPVLESPLQKGLTPAEKLLLGDPAKSTLAQKEALHQSDPYRPDFYAEYAGAYFEENHKFPSGHLETVARIDPDNSFFLYTAAGRTGGDSISKLPSKGTGSRRMRDGVSLPPITKETEWEITDEAEFAAAMELIEKASVLPRFDSYETAMAEIRISLFDQDRFVERVMALAHSASQTSQVISLMKMANVLQASAYLHSVAGDAEGFLRDHELAEAMLRQIGNSPPNNLVGELVFNAIAETTTRSLYHGSVRLGMGELSDSLGKRKSAFQENRDLREIRRGGDNVTLVEMEGSMMHRLSFSMISRQVNDPPVLRSEDLAPGRLADHNLASAAGVSSLFVSALLAGLCVLLFQFRAPQSIRVLAVRFTQLLNARDWLWILVAGIVLPFLVIFCISILTPMGGRSMSLTRTGFFFPSIHYAILLLFLLTLPPLLIHWRMGKRSGAFKLGCRVGRLSLAFPALGVCVALAAYPLVAWNMIRGGDELVLLGGLLGLWLLFILIGLLRALFGIQAFRLRRAIIARAMLPAFSLAMIITVVALPFFLASAQSRMTQDELTRVASRGFSRYEAEVADLKRKEVNQVLNR
jgi:hypothetical protein